MTTTTYSEKETMAEGEKLGRVLKPGSVVALSGELGAGKTVFARGLASGLGIETSVTSPTFTIVNEYPGDIPLFHFDMYRLDKEDELYDIGWDEYSERGGVCVVEWSEKVPGIFTPETITVKIKNLDNDTRRITVE